MPTKDYMRRKRKEQQEQWERLEKFIHDWKQHQIEKMKQGN